MSDQETQDGAAPTEPAEDEATEASGTAAKDGLTTLDNPMPAPPALDLDGGAK